MQKDLEALIKKAGQAALELYNPWEHGITFPLEGESLERAKASLDEIVKSPRSHNFQELPTEFKKLYAKFIGIASKNKRLSLSGRVLDHDLVSDFRAISGFSNTAIYKKMSTENPEGYFNVLRHSLVNFRLFMLSLAYLGTGDEQFLTEVDANQLKFLLQARYGPSIGVDTSNVPKDTTLRNDFYVSACQLIKNSLFHRYLGHLPNVRVKLNYRASPSGTVYKIIEVLDDANGLANYLSQPLTRAQTKEVFGVFSTTGGGLGGKIIAEFIDMANEKRPASQKGKYNIDLISRVEGNEPIYYNRGDDVYVAGFPKIDIALPPTHIRFKHGSIFRIFIP